MPPRICTSCPDPDCPEPHVTTDWYIIRERGHARQGDVECAEAHELRVQREVRDNLNAAARRKDA